MSFLQGVFDADLISLQVFGQHNLFLETFTLLEVFLQLLQLQIWARPETIHLQQDLMILMPDSTGLLFPNSFIETLMPSLKCVLSIHVWICKRLVECLVIHLIQDFQD